MVLWKIGGRWGARWPEEMRTLEDQESPQVFRDEVLSKEGAEEASNLMRWRQFNNKPGRDHIRLRGGGMQLI